MNKELFYKSYKREEFSPFLQSFLPKDISFQEEDFLTDEKYKTITKAQRIGTVESLDLSIIEVTHNTGDARVAISTDAFKMMADHWIHRALIIFKNDTESYRFSLLTINLDEDSRGKIVHHYSSPRRYSFFLGKDAKINTPYQQLIKKGTVKDFEDLQSRFSLEVVNKTFYAELVGFFNDLVKNETGVMQMPGTQTDELQKNFAVRLIGRIIFTWFLKQKKSEKGQLVPDEILSSDAVKKEKYIGGYYHDRLERLFFELLNKPIQERDIHGEIFDLVPYLNGGLFTPHKDDFYDLDKATATSKYINTLQISDEWFKDFFTFLETYNFTIDENTSFDQELSIDPEMLGRIFENLLAEIDEDTGTSARKATGSFYTPREIVDYMVDASLLEYFKTKTTINETKLKAMISYDRDDDTEYPLEDNEKKIVIDAITKLKTLDPACGSGAFPIGMLQKLVYILHIIDEDGKRWRNNKLKNIPELYRQKIEAELRMQSKDYIRKLEVIKNSIFGVDIQPIAVEVSRLRAFLTLIVEEEIDDTRPNRGIEPLPNLEFKFVCANSLIPAPEQSDPEQQLFTDDFQERLKIEIDKYFSASGSEKTTYLNSIRNLIDEKVEAQFKTIEGMFRHDDEKLQKALARKNEKIITTQAREMKLWESYKNLFENKPVGFFETEYFFPSVEEGFDIVIGNPPYIANYGRQAKKIMEENIDTFKKYVTFQDVSKRKTISINTVMLFFEKGMDILKKNGFLAYIIDQSFLNVDVYKHSRKYMFSNYDIVDLVSDLKFPQVIAEACVTIFKKQNNDTHEFSLKNGSIEGMARTLNNKNIKDFIINTSEYGSLLNKIEKNCLLGNYPKVETFTGMQIIPEYFLSNDDNKINLPKWHKAIFSNNVYRFYVEYPTKNQKGKYITYDNDLQTKLRKELSKKIEKGEKVRSPASLSIGSPEKEYRFKSPKIIISQTVSNSGGIVKLQSFLDEDDFYGNVSIHIVKSEDIGLLRLLLSILNSKLISFYAIQKKLILGAEKGSKKTPQIRKKSIDLLPIPEITNDNKFVSTQIESLIDQILTTKKENPKTDTTDLENKIDELVFDLYGLTEEEREVVLNS